MKTKLNSIYNDYILFPKHILFHPFDGYEDLKRYKKGKLHVALVFIAIYMLYQIVLYQYEGFLINNNNPQNLNSLQEIFGVLLIVLLFTIGNWSVTTLMEGKGTYKEILMVTGYSLFPIVIIGFPGIILSNFLTLEEMAFYSLLVYAAFAATGWMLFMGILNIHHYGLAKTIFSLGATVVAMSVMMFLGLLFFDLIQQIIAFIVAIYEEISLRY